MERDGITARNRDIQAALPTVACIHGVPGAWMTPSTCPECRAVIEASRTAAEARAREARKAAEARVRAALEAQFVQEVQEELNRLKARRRGSSPEDG